MPPIPFESTQPSALTPLELERLTVGRALPAGARIGRYEVSRVLHSGSAALVYLATDLDRKSQVVLKEYMPDRLARRDGAQVVARQVENTAALARGLSAFIDEARMLQGTEYPSLVQVLGLIEANATVYLVMPYYSGRTLLRARRRAANPPNEATVRGILPALLGALEALHRHGKVHGGVKPGNILLLGGENALLMGPGWASSAVASELVESLMSAVEPSFAAPEQHSGATQQPLGPWTDLYALAETVRFLITGVLPPPASAAPVRVRRASMLQVLQNQFGPAVAEHYSPALLSTLDAALDPLPHARPQSVAEFREKLGPGAPDEWAPTLLEAEPEPEPASPPAAVAGVVSQPALPSALAPTAPATRSRRLLAATALALLAGTAVAGLWALKSPGHADASAVAASAAKKAPVSSASAPSHAPSAVVASVAPQPAAPVSSASASAAPRYPLEEVLPPAVLTPPAAPVEAPRPMTAEARPSKPAKPVVSPSLGSPRAACGGRTEFSLYRCMQTQCAQRAWASHPQCEHLRSTDSVE